MLLSCGNSGERPLRPFTNIETVDPSGAPCEEEFTEPSALSTTGNRLGLAFSKGSCVGGDERPLTVNCTAAKLVLKASIGTAKLICVEEAYSNGAAIGCGGTSEEEIGVKLTLTPPSFVVEESGALTAVTGPSPVPKIVRS